MVEEGGREGGGGAGEGPRPSVLLIGQHRPPVNINHDWGAALSREDLH